MYKKEESAYNLLNELNIDFFKVDHPAITSVKHVPFDLPGPQVKNLVLKAKKGKKIYFVILHDEKQADLKKLAELLDEKRLSFVSEEALSTLLRVPAGSVTPLALPQNETNQINFIIDKDIDFDNTAGFHPNINTTTLMIQFHDFEKVLSYLNYEPTYVKL